MPAESLLPRARVRGPAGPDCIDRTELGRIAGELWLCVVAEGAGGGVPLREQALDRGTLGADSICTGVDDRGARGAVRRDAWQPTPRTWSRESERVRVCV